MKSFRQDGMMKMTRTKGETPKSRNESIMSQADCICPTVKPKRTWNNLIFNNIFNNQHDGPTLAPSKVTTQVLLRQYFSFGQNSMTKTRLPNTPNQVPYDDAGQTLTTWFTSVADDNTDNITTDAGMNTDINKNNEVLAGEDLQSLKDLWHQ